MADIKFSGLTETTAPAGKVIFAISENADTVPATKSISLDTLKSAVISTPSVGTLQTTAVKGGVLRCIDDAVGDVARTTDGFIEDEKYGVWFDSAATACSGVFDTAVTRTGRCTLKLSSTNTTGISVANIGFGRNTSPTIPLENAQKYSIKVKPSTKYKLSLRYKTNNVATNACTTSMYEFNSTGATRLAINSSPLLSGTNDRTSHTNTITTNASTAFLGILLTNQVAGNISDARFDINNMTIEEVKEDTTSVSTPAVPDVIVQGVTTTDNIDQSLDTGGAYANTYTPPIAISETATNLQTFTPTKKYTTQIGVRVVSKGTGNRTLTVHDASNVVLAQSTILNASVTDGAFNYFDVPNIRLTGALHFHVTSTVADGTLKTNTSTDLEACSFIHRYAKKSEGAKVVLNGAVTEGMADKDGLTTGTIVDYSKLTFSYVPSTATDAGLLAMANDIFSATNGGSTAATQANGYQLSPGATGNFLSGSASGTYEMVFKFNSLLPISGGLSVDWGVLERTDKARTIEGSRDGLTWFLLHTTGLQNNVVVRQKFITSMFDGSTVFYLKVKADTITTRLGVGSINLFARVLPTKPVGLVYPLVINQFTEEYKDGACTRLYFRLNKFPNRNGVVMPALEFTDGSAVSLAYVSVPLDNSLETNPSICLLSTTTGRQASGTGSNEASTGYILNDGEYMTVSGTPSEMKVDYRVGKGTTAFTNITKNTFYLSSNSKSSDATQDPSLQANLLLNVRNQGLQESLQNTQRELNVLRSVVPYNVVRRTVPVGTTTITETYDASELVIAVPSTASAVTIELTTKLLTSPTLKKIVIIDESGACATNNITITTQGAEKIVGADTYVMNANYQSVTLLMNGLNWFIS